METQYTLKFPINTPNGTIEKLTIRRVTRADIKAAHRYSTDNVEQEDFLLSRMVSLQIEDINALDIADSQALTDFFRRMAEGKELSPES